MDRGCRAGLDLGLGATIAVAAVGFLMLSGRLPLRRGATVVVGAFIVFGLPLIASGITGIGAAVAPASMVPPSINEFPPPTMPPPPAQPSVDDPYAGASVPVR